MDEKSISKIDYAKQIMDLSAYYELMVTQGIEGDLKSYLNGMITEDMTDEQRETIKMMIESPNIIEDVKLFFDYEIPRDGYLSQSVFSATRKMGKIQRFTHLYGGDLSTIEERYKNKYTGYTIVDDFVGKTKPAKLEPEWKHRLPHEQDRSGAVPDPVRRKLLRSKRTKSKRLR